jgi:signal peptidase I
MRPASTTTLCFADVSSDLLLQGYAVRFRAGGSSMAPAIGDGDVITVKPLDPATLTAGRVIVYRAGHRVVAHRIVAVAANLPSSTYVVVRGDAARECDPPVALSDVLGEVVAVRYGGVRSLISRFLRTLTTDRAGRLSSHEVSSKRCEA